MSLVRGSRRFLALCLLSGFILTAQPPIAVQAFQEDAAGSPAYAFGLHLFRLGEYYRAITELKRFTLLFPRHPQHAAAQLLIGLALQADGLDDDAFVHFRRLRRMQNAAVTRVAAFKLGELRFLQRRYPQAIKHFQQFLQTFPDGPLVPRTTYLLGLSWALNGQRKRARHLLDTIPPQSALAHPARALRYALQTPPPDTSKSPRTAGILAGIVPGAGHLYLGKPAHALAAFVLNGLFIAGAVFAIHDGLQATGAILLYFETGWYLGNIKSAADGAHNANRQRRHAFAERLRASYALPVLRVRQLQAPGVGLRLRF